jgi:hypothetical protein
MNGVPHSNHEIAENKLDIRGVMRAKLGTDMNVRSCISSRGLASNCKDADNLFAVSPTSDSIDDTCAKNSRSFDSTGIVESKVRTLARQSLIAEYRSRYTFQNSPGISSRPNDQAQETSNKARSNPRRNTKAKIGSTPFRNDDGHCSNDEESEDDNEEKRNKRNDVPRKKGYRSTRKRRFACPYFKRNPASDRNSRSCLGPGFIDVHRLK